MDILFLNLPAFQCYVFVIAITERIIYFIINLIKLIHYDVVTIGNGKIKIGVPGIDKDIVLEAADIDHFKSCLK